MVTRFDMENQAIQIRIGVQLERIADAFADLVAILTEHGVAAGYLTRPDEEEG